MNMNLAHIDPANEPWRFVEACVLSPDDDEMATSHFALAALEAERDKLAGFREAFNTRQHQRLLKVERAIKNVRSRRKVG